MKNGLVLSFAVAMLALAFTSGMPDSRAAGPGDLAGLKGADEVVTLRFTETEASKVFEALGAAAGFQATVEDEVKDRPLTVQAVSETVQDILEALARQYELEYEVTAAGDLVVKAGSGW